MNLYKGKSVLVTGHTGFKGSWLTTWLDLLGAKVHGYALDPLEAMLPLFNASKSSLVSDVRSDIRNYDKLTAVVANCKPDFVFHLAAQPLVLESYLRPLETVETNVMGTLNLLSAVKQESPESVVVVVTTDKCYENLEWSFPYRESDRLGGQDLYSASKACAEIVTSAWRKSFPVEGLDGSPIATARGGNVIGGGDEAENRLVPDCMRAVREGRLIEVRNPKAVRPWQHVLDCLSGYLRLGEWLGTDQSGQFEERAFNFGPESSSRRTVGELASEIVKICGGKWRDISDPNAPHEAGLLSVAIDRASTVLNWNPSWDFKTTVEKTVEFYQNVSDSTTEASYRTLMLKDIDDFMQASK